MRRFNKNKSNSTYVNLISIFVIFLLFIILSLILILIATDSYKKMKTEVDKTFNSSALVSYISNKIKSYDNNGDIISVESEEGIESILKLENKSEQLVTYIYEKDNVIYENILRSEDKFNSESGQALFEVKTLKFEKCSNNLIKFIINTKEKENISNYVNIMTNALTNE